MKTNSRKLLLSGWLKENGNTKYDSPFRLQAFLFFYEAFTKADGEKADFECLRGLKCGPIFSDVWKDYTRERLIFDSAAQKEYSVSCQEIDIERAKRSLFLVSIMSDKELSKLTRKLNIWKSQESQIVKGGLQVDLSESDFTGDDMCLMRTLEMMYPSSLVEQSYIVDIDSQYFVFSKQDAGQLTEQHFDILSELSNNYHLINPVYVELDDGRLLITSAEAALKGGFFIICGVTPPLLWGRFCVSDISDIFDLFERRQYAVYFAPKRYTA